MERLAGVSLREDAPQPSLTPRLLTVALPVDATSAAAVLSFASGRSPYRLPNMVIALCASPPAVTLVTEPVVACLQCMRRCLLSLNGNACLHC